MSGRWENVSRPVESGLILAAHTGFPANPFFAPFLMSIRLLTVLLTFALCASASAQKVQRPTGFMGVAFGAAPAEIVRVVSTRGGATAPEELPTTFDKLELTGGTFAGQEALKWTLEFVNGRFAAATVTLKPDGNGLAVFNEIRKTLVEKYGPPSGERKADKPDTSRKDRPPNGTPKADLYGKVAYWKFEPNLADKNRRAIVCEAAGADGKETADEAKLQVSVQYVDETLKPPAAKAKAGAKSGPPVKKEDL